MRNNPPKIGILALSNADSIEALFEGLSEFGWVEAKSVEVVFPPASPNPVKLEENMRVLLDAQVDLIVAQTKLAISIAKRATSTIPIIMGSLNGDPIKEGFVRDYQRPGSNITGSFFYIPEGGPGRLEVLLELRPDTKHAGIVHNPQSPPSIALAEELESAARSRGILSSLIGVRSTAEVDEAFAEATKSGVDGALAVTGAEMYACRKQFIEAQNKFRIPIVTGSIGYAEMGGVAKFGPEIPGLWKKMAPAVDQLLKGTATASELPLVRLEGFEADVNVRVAESLGLTVPASLLQRATRVHR
jgi:putative ABC transport system substrate-binding protein